MWTWLSVPSTQESSFSWNWVNLKKKDSLKQWNYAFRTYCTEKLFQNKSLKTIVLLMSQATVLDKNVIN